MLSQEQKGMCGRLCNVRWLAVLKRKIHCMALPEPKPCFDVLHELSHSCALSCRHQEHLVRARQPCLLHSAADPLLKQEVQEVGRKRVSMS